LAPFSTAWDGQYTTGRRTSLSSRSTACLIASNLAKNEGTKVQQELRASDLLQKRSFMQGKTRGAIYAGWRIAKNCCFIEIIGDTFAQC
jgi:hypothetical protein